MACTCSVAGYIDHVIFWRVQFSFVLGSVSHFLPLTPPPRLCWFFSTDVFSVMGACSFNFVWGLMAGLRCCASHGGITLTQVCWLPIVEAPGYSRHPTPILAMQLLTCNIIFYMKFNRPSVCLVFIKTRNSLTLLERPP